MINGQNEPDTIKLEPEPVTQHRWEKGESGNPKGRPKKGESYKELIREVGNEEVEGVAKKLLFCRKLYEKAIDGHDWAMKLLLEYTEGRPIARQSLVGKDGENVKGGQPQIVYFIPNNDRD